MATGRGIQICINATSTSDRLRNFSILPVELLGQNLTANPFHPHFLSLMSGVTVVRFDTWLKTDFQNTCVPHGIVDHRHCTLDCSSCGPDETLGQRGRRQCCPGIGIVVVDVVMVR